MESGVGSNSTMAMATVAGAPNTGTGPAESEGNVYCFNAPFYYLLYGAVNCLHYF